MVSQQQFSFITQLREERIGFARYIVCIPQDIIIKLPKGKKCVTGLMNGVPFSQAIQYKKNGTQFFSANATLREEASIKSGDDVKIIFSIITIAGIHQYADLEKRTQADDVGRNWTVAPTKGTLAYYVDTAMKISSQIRHSFKKVQWLKSEPKYRTKSRKNKSK